MKYKVGDKVRIKSIDWYNENKDKDGNINLPTHIFIQEMSLFCGFISTIRDVFEDMDGNVIYYMEEMDFDWTEEMIEGLVEEENNHLIETVIDTVRESNDRYRIVIDSRFDIEVDEGEYYAVRRKKKYPETFKECRDYIESCYDEPFCADLIATGYKSKLIESFAKLLVCRDAYWRIAGEEMGLEKPWEPDWRDNYQKKWTINFYQDEINLTNGPNVQFILAFPTEEMRDAFYNNFKQLIESCKELL